MSEEVKVDQFEFKAEVRQLLNILVHSLYTNREIFLRELISNASDALEKVRYETNRGAELANQDQELRIQLGFDPEAKLVTIKDSGIGMSRDELISNIGTIAKSGSAEFLAQAAGGKDDLGALIGQFGVGFYSVFMVADEVEILTKSAKTDEPAVLWRSDGLGSFTLEPGPDDTKRGTTITVHLKEDAKDYASAERIKDAITRHSGFIGFPILVGEERVNTIGALWREPKFSIKPEQYEEFYKFLTYDPNPPFETLHIAVDAPVQYNALLFIPEKGMDLPGFNSERPGLDLYVNRVLIQKGNTDLIPEYLGFVRGVVDSEDLPLNISRETLQENQALNKIAGNIKKQILSHLTKLAENDEERYVEFWKQHSSLFKAGYGDYGNQEKYAKLLRFNSSVHEDSSGLVSLEQYVSRAKEGQKEIYYAFGPSREAINLNPHMEIFRAKGLEVIYLFEPIDEFAMDALRRFQDFDLKPVEHASLETLEKFESREAEDKPEPLAGDDKTDYDKMLERMKTILGDRITQVRSSSRLQESPVCLVNPDGGMTSSMEKIMRIVSKDDSIPQKILEVNPDHRLVRNLLRIFQSGPSDRYLASVVEQLYESALLMEGYLKDPHSMVSRIQDIMEKSSAWYLEVKGE
jgi:molecular chaperone HtpG